MNRCRVGKIAQLPHEVREHVNRYLRGGGPAEQLLDALNNSPAVKEMLEREFLGEPISKQNLSVWRHGGYAEWEARQVFLEDAMELDKYGGELERSGGEKMVERLAIVLAGRYASLLLKWDGKPGGEAEAQAKFLGRLARDVEWLQRTVERSTKVQLSILKEQRVTALLLQQDRRREVQVKAENEGAETLKEFLKETKLMDIDGLRERVEAGKEEEARQIAKSEKRKAEREKRKHRTPNIERPTSNLGKEETLNPEPRTPMNREQASNSEQEGRAALPRGQSADRQQLVPTDENNELSQVVENQGVSSPVKAGQSFQKSASEATGSVPIVPEPRPEEGGMRN